MKKGLTAHCMAKNEEFFIRPAVTSILDIVDRVIIFDCGSTDGTVAEIERLEKENPGKISFEQKGECDHVRHTKLRNEMVAMTETEWMIILDGDEIWTKRGADEALRTIGENPDAICLVAPFYLCIGDAYHYSERGVFEIQGIKGHFTPRLLSTRNGIEWRGEYGKDTLYDKTGRPLLETGRVIFLKNRFWHMTHLERSSQNEAYSSGGMRQDKATPTYFLIGKEITEEIPETLHGYRRLSQMKSFVNFWPWVARKQLMRWGIKRRISRASA